MDSTRGLCALLLCAATLGACGSTSRTESSAEVNQSNAAQVAGDTTGPAVIAAAEPPGGTTAIETADSLAGARSDDAAVAADPVDIGEVAAVPELWDLRVRSVDIDASAAVQAADPANPPAPTGSRYVLVTIEGQSLSVETIQPAFDWWITDGNRTFRPSIPGCGLLPDSIYDVGDLPPGELFDAQLCVAVANDAGPALQLHLQPLGGRVWVFDL